MVEKQIAEASWMSRLTLAVCMRQQVTGVREVENKGFHLFNWGQISTNILAGKKMSVNTHIYRSSRSHTVRHQKQILYFTSSVQQVSK